MKKIATLLAGLLLLVALAGCGGSESSAPASSAPSASPFAELDDGDGELPF